MRSKAFDSVTQAEKAELPVFADSLLSLRHFNGAVNIPKLSVGEIALYDIIFENPQINIVQLNADCSNLDIFPASEKEEKKDSGPMVIPNFSIGTFEIKGPMPVRYVSLADSMNVAVTLTETKFEGNEAPKYQLDIQGLTDVEMPAFALDDLSFGIGGNIGWNHRSPYSATLSDFVLRAGKVRGELSADIDFADDLRVNSFEFNLPLTPYDDFVALIPKTFSDEFEKVKSNLGVQLGMRLTAPYSPATDSIPSCHISLNIPESKVSYERLILNRFALSAEAEIDGTDLDRSTVDLKKLLAIGIGVGFELTGKFSSLLSDPSADGTFRGGIEIDRLPSALLKQLPCEAVGQFTGRQPFQAAQKLS